MNVHMTRIVPTSILLVLLNSCCYLRSNCSTLLNLMTPNGNKAHTFDCRLEMKGETFVDPYRIIRFDSWIHSRSFQILMSCSWGSFCKSSQYMISQITSTAFTRRPSPHNLSTVHTLYPLIKWRRLGSFPCIIAVQTCHEWHSIAMYMIKKQPIFWAQLRIVSFEQRAWLISMDSMIFAWNLKLLHVTKTEVSVVK